MKYLRLLQGFVKPGIVSKRCLHLSPGHEGTKFEALVSEAEALYSAEEKHAIVTTLNNASLQELDEYGGISQVQAKKIIQYRTKRRFESIAELLNLDRISFKTVESMCSSLLSQKFTSKKSKVRSIATNPPISASQCQSVKSLVAMSLRQDYITLAHLDRSFRVLDWKRELLFGKTAPKYDHVNFLLAVQNFVKRLPDADIYIMENKLLRYQVKPHMWALILNLRTVEAMLAVLLNSHIRSDNCENAEVAQRLFVLKKDAASSYFDMLIGSEAISGQNILLDLLHGKTVCDVSVQVPPHLIENYLRMNSVEREQMCGCFLDALAFYKIVIFKSSKEDR